MLTEKPRPDGLALAFQECEPGQSRHEAVNTARPGLAYLGPAWPGSRPQAGPCTALLQDSAYGKNLNPLVSILIESGLITFVGQLAQSIMYKSATAAFPLVGGYVVMLYVRASCRLLIWCFNSSFIYLLLILHRDLRRLLSLCVSGRAFPTIIILVLVGRCSARHVRVLQV